MLKATLSRMARGLKTWDGLVWAALPASPAADALGRAVDRLPPPVRGALPLARRGVPGGLSFDELDALSARLFDAPLARCVYVQLTGWKASWVYRLFLKTKRGSVHTLIYKNATYDEAIIPALDGLPIRPGPPEYRVYREACENPEGPLAPFLPAVHLAREVDPGRHFQYVMEDLGASHRTERDASAILRIAAALPRLQQTLSDTLGEAPVGLLRYDERFRADLLSYAREPLARFAHRSGSRRAESLLSRWDALEDAYLSALHDADGKVGLLHGDPNRSNVLFSRRQSLDLRFIDWEWAGVGMPEYDLACITKAGDARTELEAVEAFAVCAESDGPERRHRRYAACKMERGLFDAAFLSIQSGETDGGPFDVEGALQRAGEALDVLTLTH